MKMIKNLLIGLMTLITLNSFATPVVHAVIRGTTISVTCNVGDTLKFYATTASMYGVTINTTLVVTPHSVIAPLYYIGYYVIVGGETSFIINSSVNWSGTITVNSGVGINEFSDTNIIEIFPNPVVDFLKIKTTEKTKVSIFNISGQLVLSKDIDEAGTTEIDMTTFTNGIYFVVVGGDKAKKIVKQ